MSGEFTREDHLRIEALEQARRYLADQAQYLPNASHQATALTETAATFFNFLTGKETITSDH